MSVETFRATLQEPRDRIIVALDDMSWGQASQCMDEVGPHVGIAKANSIADRLGYLHAVSTIDQFGVFTMADPKFHDTPSSMGSHLFETVLCAPELVTLHASNNQEALEAAVAGRNRALEALKEEIDLHGTLANRLGKDRIGLLLGVTVLTSIGSDNDPDIFDECQEIYGKKAKDKVRQFAHTALAAGLDGIVCSGEELEMIRSDRALDGLLTVVPGINPLWNVKPGGQKRVVTPTIAYQSGADLIVVGRAATKPSNGISRAEAAQRIAQELAEAA